MRNVILVTFLSLCFGVVQLVIPPEQLYIGFEKNNPSCAGVRDNLKSPCWMNKIERSDYNCRLSDTTDYIVSRKYPQYDFYKGPSCYCCGVELEFIEYGYACTRYCTQETLCSDDEKNVYGCCKSLIKIPLNFGEPPEYAYCNGQEVTDQVKQHPLLTKGSNTSSKTLKESPSHTSENPSVASPDDDDLVNFTVMSHPEESFMKEHQLKAQNTKEDSNGYSIFDNGALLF